MLTACRDACLKEINKENLELTSGVCVFSIFSKD